MITEVEPKQHFAEIGKRNDEIVESSDEVNQKVRIIF